MPGGHGKLSDSWWGSAGPATQVTVAALTWVGATYSPTVAGRLFGFRAYVSTGAQTPGFVIFWDKFSHQVLTTKNFVQQNAGADGWFQCWARPSLRLVVGTQYSVAACFPTSYHRSNTAIPGGGLTQNGLKLIESFQSTAVSPAFTAPTTNTNRNGVDLLFQAD